jgi:hypothetical protein
MMIRIALATVLTVAFLLPALILPAMGQAKRNAAKAPVKKVKNNQSKERLPAYYGRIVDDAQRARIYRIQALYADRIEALQAQLDELVAKRDAEIRDVLSPEQQQQLDAAIDEAQATKAKKAEAKKKEKAAVAR